MKKSALAIVAMLFATTMSLKVLAPMPSGCAGVECAAGCCPNKGWFCCSDNLHCADKQADCPKASIPSLLGLTKSNAKCAGVECEGGCCPMKGWYCCTDGTHCAATAKDCPTAPTVVMAETLKAGDCPGPMCDNNTACCPYAGWVCCADPKYCAKNASVCPQSVFRAALKKAPAAVKDNTCEGTECPAGCCPFKNWFCCADKLHCAKTEADCPKSEFHKFVKKQDPSETCEGTNCPAGCCPYKNWFCCKDNLHCAATADKCPGSVFHKYLTKKATATACAGTQCPDGCCPNKGWTCCPDNVHCAATSQYCPKIKDAPKKNFQALDRVQDCPGTSCPGGCCPETKWVCCSDNTHCADSVTDCPDSPQRSFLLQ